MKALLAVQGYPPDLNGGTEHSVRALAHGLAAIDVDVTVVAGTDQWQEGFRVSEDTDLAPNGATIQILRIHRADLHYGHWHKGLHHGVGKAFETLLRTHRPDVVHVHHWGRLTRDLLTRAARIGLPGVVTLHDYSATCLIHHRVRSPTSAWCEQPLSAPECSDCADHHQGRVALIERVEEEALLAHLTAQVGRELGAARKILALSHDQATAMTQLLRASGIQLPEGHAIQVEPLPSFAKQTRHPTAFHSGPLVLGCWGSHGELKGTDLLIEAVRKVVAKRGMQAVELRLAGLASPAQLSHYQELAKGLPIAITGAFEDGKLPSNPVAGGHAFVSGTRARETWGVVLDEAHSLGLPMILPAFGAYAERLGPEGAIYYSRGDATDLARAIMGVLDEPETLARVHRIAAQHMRGPNIEEHARRIRSIYAEAIRLGPRLQNLPAPDGTIGSSAWIARWDDAVSQNGFSDAAQP